MQEPIILGVTPARGGSSTIPRKNVQPIAGKPLIAWTIEAARSSRLLNRYLVSTEDREIAAIAREYGVQVLPRPARLASDAATTLMVLQHVLETVPAEIVVLLQCTSPVRDEGLIDACIKKFLDEEADSLATGFMCTWYEWGTYDKRRQELRGFFHDDGNVYVVKAERIRNGDFWGEKRVRYPTSREQNFEIDDAFDFWLNEEILKKRHGNSR